MVFPKRENYESIGERLNRQLRVPRQNALKITSPDKLSSRELYLKRELPHFAPRENCLYSPPTPAV